MIKFLTYLKLDRCLGNILLELTGQLPCTKTKAT
jgi:hypothetical protein